MKRLLFILTFLLCSLAGFSQAVTQTGFVGKFTFQSFSAGGSSDVTGTLDAFSDQTNQYFANNIQVGDVIWDNQGNRWEVMAVNSSNLLQANVDLRNINSAGGTPVGVGFVSRETPNMGLSLFVPDNNIGISQQLKSRIESHNMLLIDQYVTEHQDSVFTGAGIADTSAISNPTTGDVLVTEDGDIGFYDGENWVIFSGGGGGAGDNLGNHQATQSIVLNSNRISNDTGGDSGGLRMVGTGDIGTQFFKRSFNIGSNGSNLIPVTIWNQGLSTTNDILRLQGNGYLGMRFIGDDEAGTNFYGGAGFEYAAGSGLTMITYDETPLNFYVDTGSESMTLRADGSIFASAYDDNRSFLDPLDIYGVLVADYDGNFELADYADFAGTWLKPELEGGNDVAIETANEFTITYTDGNSEVAEYASPYELGWGVSSTAADTTFELVSSVSSSNIEYNAYSKDPVSGDYYNAVGLQLVPTYSSMSYNNILEGNGNAFFLDASGFRIDRFEEGYSQLFRINSTGRITANAYNEDRSFSESWRGLLVVDDDGNFEIADTTGLFGGGSGGAADGNGIYSGSGNVPNGTEATLANGGTFTIKDNSGGDRLRITEEANIAITATTGFTATTTSGILGLTHTGSTGQLIVQSQDERATFQGEDTRINGDTIITLNAAGGSAEITLKDSLIKVGYLADDNAPVKLLGLNANREIVQTDTLIQASNGLNDADPSASMDFELGGSLEHETIIKGENYRLNLDSLNRFQVINTQGNILLETDTLGDRQARMFLNVNNSTWENVNYGTDNRSQIRLHSNGEINLYNTNLDQTVGIRLTIEKEYILVQGMPVYADDAAADADVLLPAGAMYQTTGDRGVKIKP